MAKGAAGARDARHYSADGEVEDYGDVFVLNFFYVAEKENVAEWWLKLFEGGVESGLVVETNERVFRSGTRGGVEDVGMVFEEDGAGDGDTGTRGQEGVAEDTEDPGLEVGVGLKRVEGAEGFEKGFLYEVFGLGLIAGEPESVVIERGEERQRELFKGFAAGGGGRHGAECLGLSEVAGKQRHGVDRQALAVQHPYRKPNRRQIIP